MSSSAALRISSSNRSASPSSVHGSRFVTAAPMAIPQAREAAPPPLPPPTHIPEISSGCDPGWQWGNSPYDHTFARATTVKPGSSLLGASLQRRVEEKNHVPPHARAHRRRNSSLSTVTLTHDSEMQIDTPSRDDDDGSSPRRSPNAELTGERDLRKREIELSSQSYDKQLVNRIGGPNTPKRQSLPYTPGGAQENGVSSTERRSSSVWSVTMPERRNLSIDSTSTPKWPYSGAPSPGPTSAWSEHGMMDGTRSSSSRHGSFPFDGAGTYGGSYDQLMFINDGPRCEEGQMSNLNLHDGVTYSPKAGSKRRASSPPRERDDRSSLSSASGQLEWPHRNSMQSFPNRTSPMSRFHPNHSSLSSTSSAEPRHGSLGSSLGVASVPSSATSYASGRLSPSLLSPSFETGALGGANPSNTPTSASVHHHRTLSETTPNVSRKLSTENMFHSRSGSLSRMQAVYVCECCPKKPRKFDTEDELKLHENEKQYTCAYCYNRFKNKNEAERHQNSLHLRLHSWSCAALTGAEAAFHSSQVTHETDTCGYCGQEFSNPPQWDLRAEHLHHVHKFGECNQSKKFFRADHFRQHLKHSHHGTPGKWTNVLETACMKDEPLPEKRAPVAVTSAPVGPPPHNLLVTTTGLPAPGGPETIEETPHDS